MIIVKELPISEISQLASIKRTETVDYLYHSKNGVLVKEEKKIRIPDWSPEDNGNDHNVPAKVRGFLPLLSNGCLLGAYMDGQLAGLGSIRYGLTRDTAQLLSLHVSEPFRRRGVASALYQELERLAKMDNATYFYVSACPTGSAVGFYLSKGFKPTDEPHPELFAEEPEDIHMFKTLKKLEE